MIKTVTRQGLPSDRATRLWQRRMAHKLTIHDVANRRTVVGAKTWWQVEDGTIEPAGEKHWMFMERQLEEAIARHSVTDCGLAIMGHYWLGDPKNRR